MKPTHWRPDKEEAMTVYPIAVFAALTVGAGAVGWWRLRTLQRAIRVERAAVRLTEAAHYRDIQNVMATHRATELGEQVLAEADRIITAELARTTRHNPQEGES